MKNLLKNGIIGALVIVAFIVFGFSSWKTTAIISFVALAAFLLLNKNTLKSKSSLLSITPLKNKAITFATPHRIEMILISLYLGFFFVADLAQNKFLDNGIDYKVIVFWDQTALALDVWVVFLILFHLALMALFVYSLRSKKTSSFYDLIVGVFAFFGVAILLAGVIAQIYTQNVHFLFMDFRSIDFYHTGVYIEMGAALYWAFTA